MLLHTQLIEKTYKGRSVVKGVSIEVNQGEIIGLLGPNGAGKTTSFYMIVGLVKPDAGKVFLDNKDITNFPMYKRAQLGIGYLPQEVSVFRNLSVEDNILAILEMTKMDKKERLDRLEELLEEFSLTHVRKNLGNRLSGGEKRRTEIARSLATNPKFILGLAQLRRCLNAKILKYGLRGFRFIKRIQMNSAHTMIKKRHALFGGPVNSNSLHGGGVLLTTFHGAQQFCGEFSSAGQFGHAL